MSHGIRLVGGLTLDPGSSAEIMWQEEGADVAERGTANFIGPAITVTDDPPNNRVNITLVDTFQLSYNGGPLITTDATGEINITRGALCADADEALVIWDLDANPGRTVPLVWLSDQNVTPMDVSTLYISHSTTSTGLAVWLDRIGQAAGAATQRHSSKIRVTASMWDGAAEQARDYELYAFAPTAADESGTGRSSLAVDYEQQRMLRIRASSAAPGAAAGVIFENDVAVGAVVPFVFNATAGDFGVNTVFQIADNATLLQILGNGQLIGVAGSTTVPTYTTTGDLDTGVYFPAGDEVGITLGGSTATPGYQRLTTALAQYVRSGNTTTGYELQFKLAKTGAIGAVNDVPGSLTFYATDNAGPPGNSTEYGALNCVVTDATNGSEQARYDFYLSGGGTLHTAAVLYGQGDLYLANASANITGPELRLFLNKSVAGANGDITGLLTFYGKDTLGGTKQSGAINSRFTVATAAGEYGAIDYMVMDGGVVKTLYRVEGDGSGGGVFSGFKAAAATPTLYFRAINNFSAAQPYVYFQNNNAALTPHRMFGQGDFWCVSGAAASPGPTLELFLDKSVAGANGDIAGTILFVAKDDGGGINSFAKLEGVATTATAGGERGTFNIYTGVGVGYYHALKMDFSGVYLIDISTLQFNNNAADGNVVLNGAHAINIYGSTCTGINLYGGTAFNLALSTDSMIFTGTTDVAATVPDFVLYHNRATPADGDGCGTISFDAKDDGGAKKTFAQIAATATDYNVGTGLDGGLAISVIVAGAPSSILGCGTAGGVAAIGFFGTAPAIKQTSGADLTNNVTVGGVNDQIDDIVAATDPTAASLTSTRNAVYQLARKLKQVNDGLRKYSLFT